MFLNATGLRHAGVASHTNDKILARREKAREGRRARAATMQAAKHWRTEDVSAHRPQRPPTQTTYEAEKRHRLHYCYTTTSATLPTATFIPEPETRVHPTIYIHAFLALGELPTSLTEDYDETEIRLSFGQLGGEAEASERKRKCIRREKHIAVLYIDAKLVYTRMRAPISIAKVFIVRSSMIRTCTQLLKCCIACERPPAATHNISINVRTTGIQFIFVTNPSNAFDSPKRVAKHNTVKFFEIIFYDCFVAAAQVEVSGNGVHGLEGVKPVEAKDKKENRHHGNRHQHGGNHHQQGEHKHGEHEHKHGEHKHEEHEHEEHEHEDYKHGEHQHQHGEHKHGEHQHGEHKHGEHEHKHGEHQHGEHKHGEHQHGEHVHGEHQHNEKEQNGRHHAVQQRVQLGGRVNTLRASYILSMYKSPIGSSRETLKTSGQSETDWRDFAYNAAACMQRERARMYAYFSDFRAWRQNSSGASSRAYRARNTEIYTDVRGSASERRRAHACVTYLIYKALHAKAISCKMINFHYNTRKILVTNSTAKSVENFSSKWNRCELIMLVCKVLFEKKFDPEVSSKATSRPSCNTIYKI
ncbi:unnamed protein product [Trichogramma brassicae]|uniref:Uncharacterized protein n=1 Tax=Trichogramma brassicae TaxID=86971 RepID=A0A6H5IGP9_9HYME|nr:unnamed protein product [Trichogramma brassicae]